MDYLHIMSTQWETARHCHSALSVLSTNIQHIMETPSSEPNHSDSRDSNRNEHHHQPRSKRRRLSFPRPVNEQTQTPDISHCPTPTQPLPSTPDMQNTAATTTAYLYFPDTQQAPLPSQPSSPRLSGAGNFDLNMGDLLTGDAAAGLETAGAGFDSFLDLFGGQFPGF